MVVLVFEFGCADGVVVVVVLELVLELGCSDGDVVVVVVLVCCEFMVESVLV